MKLKKVLALTLAAAMSLSLMACGGATEEAAPAAAEETTEEVAEETTEAPAAEETEEAAPAETGALAYSAITLGDNADLTASIKWIHHKTDRAEDGTIDAMIAKFNEEYPNITVEAEEITLKMLFFVFLQATGAISCLFPQ